VKDSNLGAPSSQSCECALGHSKFHFKINDLSRFLRACARLVIARRLPNPARVCRCLPGGDERAGGPPVRSKAIRSGHICFGSQWRHRGCSWRNSSIREQTRAATSSPSVCRENERRQDANDPFGSHANQQANLGGHLYERPAGPVEHDADHQSFATDRLDAAQAAETFPKLLADDVSHQPDPAQ